MAAMVAYSFLPQKPSLNIEIIEIERQIAFGRTQLISIYAIDQDDNVIVDDAV